MPPRSTGPAKDGSQRGGGRQDQNGEKQAFASVENEVKRQSETLDRRKFKRLYDFTPSPPNASRSSTPTSENALSNPLLLPGEQSRDKMSQHRQWRHWRPRSPWSCSLPMLVTTAVAVTLLLTIVHAFVTRQLDPKGCDMCWSRPMYIKFNDFDTEHTRFASKYALHMIKEGGLDEDPSVKGVPILFIPGNAGSYKQARCLEFESAAYFSTVVQKDSEMLRKGAASLDFFTVDFNEDFSAFHGQTLLDQAEYVNDAVAYILSLYHDPRRSQRDTSLPDPNSVILIGHSMGGVVARAMLTMPNYQSNSINTIITMSAPHARAPVSVDADLVHVYNKINEYWRHAYLQAWANDNPLWHVTLISIAGGGLDTVVPSDYASLESLVPTTHGFTVFTSGIPNVWTGADHIQTTWCAQLMSAIMRSIFDTLDVHRPSQTKPRSERMRSFKRWYLTGMEDIVESTFAQQETSTLVPLENDSNTILESNERLVLRQLGDNDRLKAYLLPIPPPSAVDARKLTLLSDQPLHHERSLIEVLICGVSAPQSGQSASLLSKSIDLSGQTPGSRRLACRSAELDARSLPASTQLSSQPFDKMRPFSYLQYEVSDLVDNSFIAVIDKAIEPQKGWILAEFSEHQESTIPVGVGLRRLLGFGFHLKLPAQRPMMSLLQIPAIHSSLLGFTLQLSPQTCGDDAELFTPLLRQYIEEPYESKFFVNLKSANISLHGIAPFMPPPLHAQETAKGVSLQIWTDPTCKSSIDVSLKMDIAGSLGKLVMRYRLVFAAFPVLIVALVLQKQFSTYDQTGIFTTFSEALDQCLRKSLPLLTLALSALAVTLAASNPTFFKGQQATAISQQSNNTFSTAQFATNDLLLGSQDPFFWFLVPLFSVLSVGICVLINYAALGGTHLFYLAYDCIAARPSWMKMEDISGRSIPSSFTPSSARRRLITTCILLFLVSTFIPYQFAFIDAVLVQVLTCTRALRIVKSSNLLAHHNFYNYVHSILILMIWILPINLPVFIVWVHNLTVHWLTPFSSHHNIISIMPYLILVETLTSGKMVPRLGGSWAQYITSFSFFGLAVYAAVYGLSYAYLLHQFVNGVCAWLVAVHIWGNGGVDLKGMKEMLEGSEGEGDVKKQP